jgi:parallel beta-helix repeat protein
MKIKMKNVFILLLLIPIIFSISTQLTPKNRIETTQADLKNGTSNLRQAGFWNNLTFIHITGSNWTLTNQSDWCSGSGTFGDPYLIENMIINASGSPTGCGIFIENSNSVYFKIRNITIFEATNGIKLENTNNGFLINNILLNNIESGIYAVNCVNNTISINQLINNGLYGVHLSSNCLNNKILGNIAKNDGTNLQDAGIYLENFCINNEIKKNLVYDNNVYGINIEDSCEGNIIFNNTLKNVAANLQDYGIRLDNDCHQNNISLNIIKDLNSYAIMLVTSDENSVSNNNIIDCALGFYMLIAHQSEIFGNIISDCNMGILMSACDDGKIFGNYINNTGSHAIRIIINCDNNELHDNIIKDNINIGVQLDDPSDVNNLFYKNSFISNRIHAIDNGTSTLWNITMIGNYWDNYSGTDLNNDNIGDTPYNLPGSANATDNLPIVDNGPPIIIINDPTSSSYGADAPEFNIFVNESYIYSMWYTINNSGTKYYFTENGTIDQDAWNTLSDGHVVITFYARDIAWNKGSSSVELIKNTSQVPGEPDDGSLPFNVIIIIAISIVVISLILIAAIIIKRRGITEKVKKSRKLDEEQISKADYFKDITSILTILAIHKDSGLCLSKLALHGGIGLDENLFTGFISAMGSFKDELAKQMGLRLRDGGGDNTIEYNEFTITLMEGEYLRLGLVSYNSLGDLIKKQCGQVLRAYELEHINELQNFDGEIQIFDDFEEAIESGLELNLNKKCTINMNQLHKFDAPESFIKILNDFNSRSEGFYPAEISLAFMQELNISDQEANFMLYKAYKNQIFLPK